MRRLLEGDLRGIMTAMGCAMIPAMVADSPTVDNETTTDSRPQESRVLARMLGLVLVLYGLVFLIRAQFLPWVGVKDGGPTFGLSGEVPRWRGPSGSLT